MRPAKNGDMNTPSAHVPTAPDRVDRQPLSTGLLLPTALLVAGSLALGALTSWAQGVLPDAWASLANSTSGWTAATAVVVAATRPGIVRGALFGVVAFVCLVLGYTVASELRGLYYNPIMWSTIGVLAGPFVGAAAAGVVSRRPHLVSIGAGLLAGVLVADGIYGLTVVADTTSPVYWTTALIAGLLFTVVVGATRLRSAPMIVLQVATLAGSAAFLTLSYSILGSLG